METPLIYESNKNSEFKVSLSPLFHRQKSHFFIDRESYLEGVSLSGSQVLSNELIKLHAKIEWVKAGVLVSGTVTTFWVGECSRCLREVRSEIYLSLREIYSKHPDLESEYPILGDQIDIGLAIHDNLLLSLPLVPLCSQSCRGICQYCGIDLNSSECGCKPEINGPFSVLSKYLKTS